MATLTSEQRQEVRAELSALLSHARQPFALTKAQFLAAIEATDDWIEANAASFNSALPAAARTGLTAAQKARLFYFVALKRFGG